MKTVLKAVVAGIFALTLIGCSQENAKPTEPTAATDTTTAPAAEKSSDQTSSENNQ